jgi:hypothetical protein
MAKKPTGNAVVVPNRDLGEKPEFRWLRLDNLVVDERYQRRITGDGITLINRIVREFDWSKFQPLTVTGPDASGDYPVIDGQHRLEACRRHPDVEDVPCWIVAAPHLADQARSFVAVNKHRIGVTRINVFWAQLTAGHPDAVWIKGICERGGVKVGKVGTGIQPPLTTIALAALLKLRVLGDDTVAAALAILAKAQPEAENAFRGAAITALAKLIGLHGENVDRPRLVERLADLVLDDEIDKARAFRKAMGGTVEEALQVILVRAYNKGLGATNRLPEK